MSDREAFEKWAADKDFIIGTPVCRISLKAAAWEVWQAAQAQAGDGEAVAWMYEHDGMIHDKDHQPIFTTHRWDFVNEPYAETALYTHPQPQVNQQLLAALQKAESHMHAMMAHIDHKPRRFQEHCWQQVLDIRAAIAAAQEQVSRPAKGE